MITVLSRHRSAIVFSTLTVMSIIVGLACIFIGSVDIPFDEVVNSLIGKGTQKPTWDYIIHESRIPLTITAALAGAALAISGLLMQTTFQNPLAGPSILGVSTGASMGVAILTLGAGGLLQGIFGNHIGEYVTNIVGALLGAGIIIAILIGFSSVIRNTLMLLIIGILISYLSSSTISLLNFFSSAEEVKSYVVWGLGSYSGVTTQQLPLFALSTIIALLWSLTLSKPLNALLLGERYVQNMGYNIRNLRNSLLTISGVLTAIVTAFCGPIGFLGLIAPHVARLMLNSSNHVILIPATILCGAFISLLCTLLSVLPSSIGVIPINAITPIIGVPIILYVILNRKRINYFN